MSLQKIGKYTEIFESSRKLQRPTQFDSRRAAIIQNIAVAGLIDSGAPYECENGEIIIDTGLEYKSVMLNEVFPYLSPEGMSSVVIKNAQKSELPPPGYYQQPADAQPQYTGYEQQAYPNYQNISVQPAPDTVPVQQPQPEHLEGNYQTEASKEAEKKADPIKAMMDGLEDYSTEQEQNINTEPTAEDKEIEELFNNNLKQKKAEQRKWQDASEIPPVQTRPQQEANVQPEQSALVQGTTVMNENPDGTTSILTSESEQPVFQEEIPTEADVVELNKNVLTYERCNLEIISSITGRTYRFSVHAAPVTNINDDNIIVRIKLLGKDSNYIQTNYGTVVDFTIEQTFISVKREKRQDGVFSCIYTASEGYSINKLNIERGGNGGNLVIYDNNLELRIFPLANIKDPNTGKMVFGNNKKDEAAYLYYIKTNNTVIASSGVERKPTFKYNGCDLIIMAKWFGDTIRLSADEYTGEK